jgi:hypothetical protein
MPLNKARFLFVFFGDGMKVKRVQTLFVRMCYTFCI